MTNRLADANFSLFTARGLDSYDGIDPDDFTPEHNAWCITAGLNDSSRAVTPVLFTRNLEISNLDDTLDDALTEKKPFW